MRLRGLTAATILAARFGGSASFAGSIGAAGSASSLVVGLL